MATAMNATTASICLHNGTAHDGTILCHWANSPGARGTLNIFWLCISTLGLCVWNAVHPDVPRPNTPRWRVLGKRVWMLFVGLFMPEMLVLVALGQLRQACNLLVKMDQKTAAPTQFPWWMYLLESWRPKRRNSDYEAKWWMRGLLSCLQASSTSPAREPQAPALDSDLERRFQESLPPRPSEDSDFDINAFNQALPPLREFANSSSHALDSFEPTVYSPPTLGCEREHCWTLTHSFYAVMDGFVDSHGDGISLDHPYRASKTVHGRMALPLGDPKRIPDLSVDDIEDRGKAGVLAKSLLVWQLFVFLANCFARWDQSLPLSLLEITTIGHSLCSIIAMVLWWYKPHSIGEATVIDRQGPLPPLSNVKILSWSFLADSSSNGLSRVFGDSSDSMDVPRTVAIAAIAILYGLPHLLGLSVHFPTFAEQLCWTIATFTVIGSPLAMCGILWIAAYGRKRSWDVKAVGILLLVLLIILLVLYPVASMILVGESVRQIFALPVESFREPQLATYLPSFS